MPDAVGTVFISYCHEGSEHDGAVLNLSNTLRSHGINCLIDQYESSPPRGWPHWSYQETEKAEFVLIVCTERYYRSVTEEADDSGLGVSFEFSLVYDHLYFNRLLNTKFISILFSKENVQYIPRPLRTGTWYCIPDDYEHLCARLLGELPSEKPPLGKRRPLPRREVKSSDFSAVSSSLRRPYVGAVLASGETGLPWSQVTSTAPPLEGSTTASAWVPLWHVIEPIASAIGDSREPELYARTRLSIRQAALDGRLRIRGRHEIERPGQDRTLFSDVYTEIPSAYWKHSVINAFAIGALYEADRHTNPETVYAWGPKGLLETHCYTGLQLNSDDVLKVIDDARSTGFSADAKMSENEEWISAASALALLGMNHNTGTRTICKRAHAGLIKARAERFISDGRMSDNVDIPLEFWWAEGGEALNQDWATGDFDTWIDHGVHLQAFGVTFHRADIERTKPTAITDHPASQGSTHAKADPVKFSDAVTLKPGLSGMSIDLLTAWKWLRERLHSFGGKQQAMPHFPETASIASRLWRDPVWSKVIATGITAAIGALVVWYYHTTNPPSLVTTPTPAIPAAPPAVTQQSPVSSPTVNQQGPTALPNPPQHPVIWDRNSQFLVVSGGGPSAQINSVLLQGTSTRSVSIKEADAVSGLTGHKQELMGNVQYQGYYPVDQVDIPPQAPVWLELIFKPPISIRDFVERWG